MTSILTQDYIFSKRFEKSNFTVFFACLNGLFLILFLVWCRLVVDRLSRDTRETNSFIFWCVLLSFVIYLLFVIFLLLTLRSKRNVSNYIANKHLIKDNFITYCRCYIIQSPEFFFFFMYKNMTGIWVRKQIEKIICQGSIILLYNIFRDYITWIVFLLDYMLKIILFSTFLYEVAINQKIEYFYNWLWVLLIPLGFRLVISFLEEVLKKNIDQVILKISVMPQNITIAFNSSGEFLCDILVSKKVEEYCQNVRKDLKTFMFYKHHFQKNWMFVDKIWYMRKKDPSIMSDEEFLEHCERFQKNCNGYSICLDFMLVKFSYEYIISIIIITLLLLTFFIWLLTILGLYNL
jgi:hypothetical protein